MIHIKYKRQEEDILIVDVFKEGGRLHMGTRKSEGI